jgi:hypothetical protein
VPVEPNHVATVLLSCANSCHRLLKIAFGTHYWLCFMTKITTMSSGHESRLKPAFDRFFLYIRCLNPQGVPQWHEQTQATYWQWRWQCRGWSRPTHT